MATVPFLKNIGLATGWYSQTELMNMLAVSESTPGPIGINMATYVGFAVAGIPGAVIATIGEMTPSIIVILIVVAMLTKFRDSKYVSQRLLRSAPRLLRPHCRRLRRCGASGIAPGQQLCHRSMEQLPVGRFSELYGPCPCGGAAGADQLCQGH